MTSEENYIPPPPSHHQEKYIVIEVPPKTSKEVIEAEIHRALAQGDDIFKNRASEDLIIMIKQEKNFPFPKPK